MTIRSRHGSHEGARHGQRSSPGGDAQIRCGGVPDGRQGEKIWLDGELVDWDDAKVHILTHSLHYGLGAFEGIRAYKRADGKTNVFRLQEHIDAPLRLVQDDATSSPQFTREQMARRASRRSRVNGMAEGYLRPMVFVGEGAMGIYAPNNPVRATVIAWKWGAYLGDEALKNGIRAKISSFARHHINVSLAKAKMMGQYTNSVLAKREAKFGGYDEAILLDAQRLRVAKARARTSSS